MKDKVRVDGMDDVIKALNKIWDKASDVRSTSSQLLIVQLTLLALILWRVW